MSSVEIRPLRFALIGALLVVPTCIVLIMLAAQGLLPFPVALVLILALIGVAWAVLRTVYLDIRLLADQMERLGEAEEALVPAAARSSSAQAVLAAAARAHQHWLDRCAQGERRIAAGEAVVEALHDPLLLVGAERRVLRANSAARGLFGERMVGRDLAVSLRNPVLLEAVDAVLAGGTSRTVEFLLPVPVERTLEARVKPFPLEQEGGEDAPIRAALVTLHDITLLKRSEQMRADFVANASHELRTPLATLIGFVETLRGPARDDMEAHDRFLGIMHEQANRMSRLVNDLLSLSRIEMDEHSPPTGTADVPEIVRKVVAMLELKAASRKIRLRIEGPAELPPVLGDEDQLAQVFQNLIDNALKYSREQSEVTVRLSALEPRGGTAGAVCISVADQGEGIPRTHLPRLTERFYRVDAARSRALGGTGLGLAIVKHIVNRHRGRLSIDSEVGKGSTFTIQLPVATLRSGILPASASMAG
ncbi:ATP-binding protein [Indioceanicola profundi]|uniref:ATP-binding protein n=1 Tax=Indioceanicola profundi TaxID=2220096 RepID=UPI000E6AE121|nr:ATP-binding protein [Indioceanicola profundi]